MSFCALTASNAPILYSNRTKPTVVSRNILLDRLQDGQLRVLDPMYRPGRYDIHGRAGRVRMEGYAAWCDCELLRPDCFERPYFVFQ